MPGHDAAGDAVSGSSLSGQVAVVTGAGRGLGRAFALDLARHGAAVVVNDLPGAGADEVVAEIQRAGGSAVAAEHDIADPDGARRIVAAARDLGQLAVLVNNAGITRPGMFGELDLARIRQVIDVHLLGTLYVSQPAYQAMQEAGYGRIVNIGSNSAFGIPGIVNYSAAKAAMFGVTQTLALEGAPYGIRVNTVLPAAATKISETNPIPGFYADPRVRAAFDGIAQRLEPERSAGLVTYLSSPQCAVTGQHFSAVGGRYARVVFGVAAGWSSPGSDIASADDIAAHIDAISSADPIGLLPAAAVDEIEAVARGLRPDTAG